MWFEDRPPPQWLPYTLPDGSSLQVPELIVRGDDAGQPGWQLRFGEWTFFADGAASDGAAQALALAIAEMEERIAYRGK